ncbi:MAG: winged helix-turn-helix domain-containing protein [Candidatus Saccharicenans sp.]|uniref:winged helix-turn-helix domain-containing protein n=1 Tax=Candidatus Saccharicenans sp. TaxID=2819258 RepID=UPI004049A20C
MRTEDRNEVNEAFEILLEEIEAVANMLNEEGAQAFHKGDYSKAKSAIEEATRLSEFREKVEGLKKEWLKFFATGRRGRKEKGRRKSRARLSRGMRTPVDAFRRPVLETLAEVGGSSPIGEVMNRVGLKMKDVLNKYDRETMSSDPRTVRWRNTVKWCRDTLVREGLMKSDSPYGIWEISKQGQIWLANQEN